MDYDMKRLQGVQLELLDELLRGCRANDIPFYLAAGSCIGAIRHQGFIPWDDDIDIMMPRPDYIRLLKEYDGKYKILKPEAGLLYYAKAYDPTTIKYEADTDYRKNKAIGVDIDIFPLDGIVNDQEVIDKLYKKECFLEMLLRLSNQPIFLRKNPLKAINRIVPRIIGSKNIVKMIEKNAMTYDYDTSDYVIRMRWSPNGFTGALPKSVFEKSTAMFEGHEFCIPAGYDEFLTAFFGDYMRIPDEDERVTHKFKCYRIEDE